MSLILPSLPKPLSYTAMNDYKSCPKRYWHKHLKKDIPEEVKTREQRGGSWIHDALKKRLKIREPLPIEFRQHEPVCRMLEEHQSIKHMELKLGVKADGSPCDFFDPAVCLRGAVDLACSASPHVLFVDWKSGKPWEDPFELKVQAVLFKAHYPDITHLSGFYYWLRHLKVGTLHQLDPWQAWQSICELAEAISGRLQRMDWPADEGPLCPWCPLPKGIGQPLDPVCVHRRDPSQR